MKPKVVNKCSKSYRIDHKKIIEKVLERIPDKFLYGLSEITFLNKGKTTSQRIKYLFGKGEKSSRIEINMDYDDYSKYPFFSVFSLNIDFILKINEHIERSVEPRTDDSVLLLKSRNRINYNWMYLGIWTPIIYLIILFTYPVQKLQAFRNVVFYLSDRIVKKAKKKKEGKGVGHD